MDIMGAKDLSILSLISLLIFIVPIFIINMRLKLGVNKTMVVSVVRMCLQLSFVGFYLEVLFKYDSILLNVVYLLIMIFIACHAIVRSAKLKIRKFFFPIFFSVLVPFSTLLIFFNVVLVRIDNPFEAKYLIPVGGMLLGNSMKSNIICLNSFFSGIKKDEKIYFTSLTLLGSRIQALKPYLKKSILASITPVLASIATIGLVSLPGMLTGQILGGSVPLVAIKYQIAIMFAIFYTDYFSTLLSLLFSVKFGFNAFDVLKKDIFNEGV